MASAAARGCARRVRLAGVRGPAHPRPAEPRARPSTPRRRRATDRARASRTSAILATSIATGIQATAARRPLTSQTAALAGLSAPQTMSSRPSVRPAVNARTPRAFRGTSTVTAIWPTAARRLSAYRIAASAGPLASPPTLLRPCAPRAAAGARTRPAPRSTAPGPFTLIATATWPTVARAILQWRQRADRARILPAAAPSAGRWSPVSTPAVATEDSNGPLEGNERLALTYNLKIVPSQG
jgi:hypothetical protein